MLIEIGNTMAEIIFFLNLKGKHFLKGRRYPKTKQKDKDRK